MDKLKDSIAIPSAAYSVKVKDLKFYEDTDKPPAAGDMVYGRVVRIGEHASLENRSGRIHTIHNGTLGLFVFGNRYAPDYYEGMVPEMFQEEVDLLARSGIVGVAKNKNSLRKDPTKVQILGYVCDEDGNVVNTTDYSLVEETGKIRKTPRAKLILVCGTSMNSGKSMAASACCWALNDAGYKISASKVTGTASLKDILNMNDSGAEQYSDFTFLGFPSTYLLEEDELISIFNKLDAKYASNPKGYWIVEFADGIIQRETAMLLSHPDVRSRIHKLIFCAQDAFGVIGGIRILKERFGLTPHAISGVCSSSPLHVREMSEYINIPVFNNTNPDIEMLKRTLIS